MSNGITRLTLRIHHLSRACHRRGWTRPARLVAAFGRLVTGIEIDPSARISPGLVIQHGQGLVIGPSVEIGRDCCIHQGVALGEKDDGYPSVGDRVTLFPGSKIVGAVHVGDDAQVGANAVVLHDVAPGDVVAGVPARSVRRAR